MIETLKKFWPYLRQHRGPLFLVLLSGFFMSAFKSGALQLLKVLFDKVFTAKDPLLVTLVPLGFIVLYALHGIARFVHIYWIRYTSECVATTVRRELKQNLIGLNMAFHGNYEGGTGGLMSRTLNDVNTLQIGIIMVSDLLREPFLAVFLIVQIFYEDWKLSAASFLLAPLIFVIMRQLSRSLRKYGHKNQESLEALTALVKESLDGMRIIQSYNLENEMRRRYDRVAGHFLDTKRKIIIREELAGPITEFLGSTIFAGLCIYMGHKIIRGEATAGVFMEFVAALTLMQQPLKKLQEVHLKLQHSGVAADRLFSLMRNESRVREIAEPKSFPPEWKQISFDHISFAYNKEIVLKDINFEIQRGEVIALVGESGSGKSTLVQLLERFFDPTQGEIRIDDVPIHHLRVRDLRSQIALVTQDIFLFNDTISNNILMGDQTKSQLDVERAAQLAHAHDFILSLPEGYQTRMGDRGSLLSGGERQRISIARAILKNAPILILDEATSALDSASEIEVQKGLEELLKGRTALIIAHRLATIQNAHRIFVLRKGEIIEEGAHADLLQKKGEYFRFCCMQNLQFDFPS